jgi:hypothetical protein
MAGTLLGTRAFDMLDEVCHTVCDVGKTSTLVVGVNPNRRYLLVINDSDETIYIAHGEPAQLNRGVRIEKNGGREEYSLSRANLCQHPIYAIQSKNTPKRLLVTEGM